jgi:hypothetical protein
MQGDSTVVAQSVAQVIDILATKFGATSAHLWRVMVQQVRAEAIGDVIMILGLALVTAIGAWLLKRGIQADDDTQGTAGMITVLAGGVFGVAIAFASAQDIVTAILNPEYGALKIALALVKGGH